MGRTIYVAAWVSSDNYLEHYGRKGMKWGQHIFGKDPSQTVSRRDYEKGYYQRDKNADFTIPKGTKLYRMSYNEKDDMNTLYVTRTDMDRKHYKALYEDSVMSRDEKGKKKTGPIYEQTFEVQEDLKIPSENTRKAVMKEVITDPKLQQKIGKDIANDFVFMVGGIRVNDLKEAKDYAKTVADDEFMKSKWKEIISGAKSAPKVYSDKIEGSDETESYKQLSKTISISKTARDAYAEKLQAMGYNATVDDYGRKGLWGPRNGETSEALILFGSGQNKTKQLSSKKSSSVSARAKSKNEIDKLKYDARILGNKYSGNQVKAYGKKQLKSVLATIGTLPLNLVAPGAGVVLNDTLQRIINDDYTKVYLENEQKKYEESLKKK